MLNFFRFKNGVVGALSKGVQSQALSILKQIKPGASLCASLAGTSIASKDATKKAAKSLRRLYKSDTFKSAQRIDSSNIKLSSKLHSKIKIPHEFNTDNKFGPLGRGNTGRSKARYLIEKMVMQEAIADPYIGEVVDIGKGMTDPRWHKDKGWKKMTWHDKVHDIEVHYVAQWDKKTIIAVDDFKFKERPPFKKTLKKTKK